MAAVLRTLTDPVTYRRLAYLLLGLPLGTIWFTCLVTLWSLCFGFIVTPLVIPAAIALAYATRGFTVVEADLARALLDVDARVPAISSRWDRPGGRGCADLFGPGFWRAQGFLWTRWLLGFPAGVADGGAAGCCAGMITGPIWIPVRARRLQTWASGTSTRSCSRWRWFPSGSCCCRRRWRSRGRSATPSDRSPRGCSARAMPAARSRLRMLTGSARAGIAFAGPSRRGLVVAYAVVDGSLLTVLIFIWAVTSPRRLLADLGGAAVGDGARHACLAV